VKELLTGAGPDAVGGLSPHVAVPVEPFTDAEARLRFGTHAQHVAAEIFDLHLASPRIVSGWMADFGAPAIVFLEEGFRVADADPDP
jgi:hypothetical protein